MKKWETTTSHGPDAPTLFMQVAEASTVIVTGNLERPVADKAFVIQWEDAGIVIPWPKTMTAKEAIINWAIRERAQE